MPRLLVIEDHKRLLKSLKRGLSAEGYEVVTAESGESGYYYATTEEFDCVILDVMLPGRSGLEVLRDLRAAGYSRPVLILSARDSTEDRVTGLDEGADDYLVKPFAFEELLARLRALLHRGLPGPRTSLKAGQLELHVPTRTVSRAGRTVELSKLECRVLEYLLRHKNEPVSRDALARDVWNEPQGVTTNVVDVCINSLRKKIERDGLEKLIHTVRGVGYALYDGPPRPAARRTAGEVD